ncbi:IS66 family insertion sequence element accessory protein TnpB [Paraburkholderia sp. J8-2]|uniref:IS66 family insertion sequence element accessory protein TnpB n=1 Tax=Paraburkholderia sp. J8-2 TaxID=2805440 RepID=UPI0039F05439
MTCVLASIRLRRTYRRCPYGGLYLFAKRLETERLAWPRADAGVVALTTAQLSLLLEAFDWRQPVEAARPRSAL